MVLAVVAGCLKQMFLAVLAGCLEEVILAIPAECLEEVVLAILIEHLIIIYINIYRDLSTYTCMITHVCMHMGMWVWMNVDACERMNIHVCTCRHMHERGRMNAGRMHAWKSGRVDAAI